MERREARKARTTQRKQARNAKWRANQIAASTQFIVDLQERDAA